MSFQIENNQTTNGFQTPEQTATAGTVDGTMSTEQIDSLVKRDANAQQHITNLETEAQEQRDAMSAMQQTVARLEGTLSATGQVKDMIAGMQPGQQTPTVAVVETPSVEDIVAQATAKVTADLDAKVQKDLQASNYNKIAEVLTSTYGDKANEHVTTIATQNSMSFEEAQDMARNNPTLFSNLFIKTVDTGFSAAPSAGATNTSAAQSTDKVDAAYWNQMRRDNRSKFWTDMSVQKQYREWISTQTN